MHTVRGSLWSFLQKIFVNGPYEILDELYMDNHLLIDHLSGETPLKNMISFSSGGLLLRIYSFLSLRK